jgi:phenylpyruvate tautomerase PptA (4-oxalocrotonate tautomerase family)
MRFKWQRLCGRNRLGQESPEIQAGEMMVPRAQDPDRRRRSVTIARVQKQNLRWNPEKENHSMPFIRIDAIEGRTQSEVTTLLDAVHRAVVKAFHVPVRDRYQVYQAHPKGSLVIQDTGLNISRTDKALIITVVSKARDEILKRRFYKEVTEQLASSASIAPSDVMVAIVENSAADWSFGNGEPQFLTGELG